MSSIGLVAGAAEGCVGVGRVAVGVEDGCTVGGRVAVGFGLAETVPMIGGGVLPGAGRG